MNHPIDALGKLRITYANITQGTCDMELNYLCGMSLTTLIYIRHEKKFRILDHMDFISQNRNAVEILIEENREHLQTYIKHLIEMNEN